MDHPGTPCIKPSCETKETACDTISSPVKGEKSFRTDPEGGSSLLNQPNKSCAKHDVSRPDCTVGTVEMQSPALSFCLSDLGLPSSFGRQKGVKRKASFSYVEDDVDSIVEQCFSQNFKFQPGKWTLPDAALLFRSEPWRLTKFQDLKKRLNSIKDELSGLSLNDWHQHTKSRNRAGSVLWQLKHKLDPELLTQAWCKFYEIASSFPLVSDKVIQSKALSSVHLCEAPGAFITSLNHYLRSLYGKDFLWQWRATTLNPYYEGNPLSCMINDDRFILQTLSNWTFGEDYTGNLMNKSNFQHLVKNISSLGEICLVTADGSIDCQDNPSEQETVVSWLQCCETIAALNMLSPGGNFLVKMFTMFEYSSICLMYLLNCAFKTVYVIKPVCSKAGNSEVYVLCCEYFGKEHCYSWLQVLNEIYGDHAPSCALFALHHIPPDFLEQLYQCADRFTSCQIKAIQENIHTFRFPSAHDRYITSVLRRKIANEFFERFHLVKLNPVYHLINNAVLRETISPNIDTRMEDVSHNDRQRRRTMSPDEELLYLRDDIDHIVVSCSSDDEVFWFDFPHSLEDFCIVRGKSLVEVNSSKFCLGRLLYIWNRVKDIAKNHLNFDVSNMDCERNEKCFHWPGSVSDVVSLDLKNSAWTTLTNGSFALQGSKLCQDVLSTVGSMRLHQCFQLSGFPMLTQLHVGLIFLIAHLFEKVGFLHSQEHDFVVLFYDFRSWDPTVRDYWMKLEEVMMAGDSASVLSIVPVLKLSNGDFYKLVTEINNHCVQGRIKKLLKKVIPSA